MKSKNMKTVLLMVIVSTIGASNLFSQKIKKETIYNRGLGVNYRVLWVDLTLENNNSIASRELFLAGQDHRFSKITSIINVYRGTTKEVNIFLLKLEDFYEENEKETYDTIEGVRIRRAKFGIGVYDKDGLGQTGFHIKDLRKIREALVKWANENNEPLE